MKQKTGLKDVIINGFKWTPFEWTLLETGSDIKKELMQLVSHAEVMCACEKILQTTILIFTTEAQSTGFLNYSFSCFDPFTCANASKSPSARAQTLLHSRQMHL